jgi:hypothetical protein
MRQSLIDTVTIVCSLYGKFTELSSCGLRKNGRILLAATTYEPRLRTGHRPGLPIRYAKPPLAPFQQKLPNRESAEKFPDLRHVSHASLLVW